MSWPGEELAVSATGLFVCEACGREYVTPLAATACAYEDEHE